MRVNEFGGRDGANAGAVSVMPDHRLRVRKSLGKGTSTRRRIKWGWSARIAAGIFAIAAVQACTPTFNTGGGSGVQDAVVSTGETLGSGTVRVAMLLPQSASGNAGSTGKAYRNAAELATRDFPDANIQLVFYDSGGTPSSAQIAANKAVAEGAKLILGPLFASEVRSVAPVARRARVPVVAFSSDSTVAGSGVYLLSFLPANNVNAVIDFAAARGKRAYAALVPNDGYGAVVEAAFRQRVAARGGRVITVERYQSGQADVQAKAAKIAGEAQRYDTLLIPGAGQDIEKIAASLSAAGLSSSKVTYLGSGQWDDGSIQNNANLAGAYYPAPDRKSYDAFAQRYSAAFGGAPPRRASLAYDGVVLAAGLVRQFGSDPFSQTVLTNQSGFAGVDGVFRFLKNGSNQRLLSIYQVTGSGTRLERPAPKIFSDSGT